MNKYNAELRYLTNKKTERRSRERAQSAKHYTSNLNKRDLHVAGGNYHTLFKVNRSMKD